MKLDVLNMDRLPTLEELKQLFKENDWTNMKIDDPAKRTAEQKEEIAYVAGVMDKKFEELAKKKGRKSAKKYYGNKEYDNLNLLKSEVVKAIKGESAFSTEILSQLIVESESKCNELFELCSAAEKEVTDTEDLLKNLSNNYDELISWAELYDDASFEQKKMIVACLIKRIEVFRDYKLKIDFNINFEQFIKGLDCIENAA